MSSNGIDWLCLPTSASLAEVLRRQAGAGERGLAAGIALVVDAEGRLAGTITDGDVRRAILRAGTLELTAGEVMRTDPIHFPEGTSFRAILRALPGELARRRRASARFLGKIVLVDEARRPTRVLDYHQLWEQRVATHRHVVVVGMGYVGLTLALELAEEGFRVTGIDADEKTLAALARGEAHVHEVGLEELLREQLRASFSLASEIPPGGDVFVVAVGTPVGPDQRPDLRALETAVDKVGARLAPGGLVVLRSTVPVGTTREVVGPRLERATGLIAGQDFHLAYAPERTSEGNALVELRSLPQIIGALNEDSLEATVALFRELTPTVVRVESLEAAELAKLVNNAFRDLSFAFANQIAQIAVPFNLNAAAVIRAANHGYPRDRVPAPSPGVGGPCLSKDPHILASVAARAGLETTLFQHGRRVNEAMHELVATALLDRLRGLGKRPGECTVLVCGLAFKGEPETGDLRSSSGLAIARLLQPVVGRLLAHDPVVAPAVLVAEGLEPAQLPEGARGCDAVLFLNNHRAYRRLDAFELVRGLRAPGIIYDAWGLIREDDVVKTCPSVYMGVGFVRSSV